MTIWAHVENNEVTGVYDILPNNWRNISGLNLSINDTEYLNSVGWFRIIVENQTFDIENYKIKRWNYSFENNSVVATPVIVEITEEERQAAIQSQISQQNHFIEEQRKQRNIKLQESDWVMFPDIIELKGQEWYNNWKTYRQLLRDLPQTYPDGNYNWPEIPN